MRIVTALAACMLALPGAAAAQAGDGTVTVYRCTDAAGRASLRDTPCPAGQKQQAREMLRPRDAPRTQAATPAPAPAAQPAPPPATRYVYLAPPQPMYECTTYEGKRYTSDNGEGNPRWVPYWTLGYPAIAPHARGGIGTPPPPARPGRPAPPPAGPRPPHAPLAAGGGWIRDECRQLPQAEACARLRDRKAEVGSRFFNAMPSERDQLRKEERALKARLDNDCGGG